MIRRWWRGLWARDLDREVRRNRAAAAALDRAIREMFEG